MVIDVGVILGLLCAFAAVYLASLAISDRKPHVEISFFRSPWFLLFQPSALEDDGRRYLRLFWLALLGFFVCCAISGICAITLEASSTAPI
jgi:hypothetical protein